MSLSTEDKPADPDVVINRLKVFEARFSRVLESQLGAKSEQESSLKGDIEDEDFFTEVGGVGSKAERVEDAYDSLTARRRTTSVDAVLENILGKKGAQAKKKKDLESSKDKSTNGLEASKPLAKAQKQERTVQQNSDDEDEGGRASAFKSRKPRTKPSQERQLRHKDTANPNVATVVIASDAVATDEQDLDTAHQAEQRPAKRKKASYLDEVLAQKSKKRSKKSKQGANG